VRRWCSPWCAACWGRWSPCASPATRRAGCCWLPKPGESSDYIIGLYQRACAHADRVIAALDLQAPGTVAHWPQDRRETTLAVLLIRMVAETAQHAGHADIVREIIDGKGGPDQDTIDEATWREYLAQVQAAADAFATGPGTQPGP
jgi:Protein of unknown function (DUF664)